MPRKRRISRPDFASLSKGPARRFHGSIFTLSASPLPEGALSKCACVVSKKVARKAVDRNLLRRRCREIARPLLDTIPMPTTLVFYAKREALGTSFSEIRKDVEALLAKTR